MNKKYEFSAEMGVFLAIVLALSFLLEPTVSHAQYSQVNNNGNTYTYVNNYGQLNITTTNATNLTSSSAILNGLVNGSNLYSTYNIETWFEYGTNAKLEYSTVHNPSNSGYANFSSKISGLNPNTIYYFRAIGRNPQGVVYGSVNSFRTSPFDVGGTSDGINPSLSSAITEPASFISNNSVQLNSLIYSGADGSSNAWFEWGTTTNLGNTTTVVSTGELPAIRHADMLTGLAPGTIYYFRAVTENSSWRNNGSILSFVTTNEKQNTNTTTIIKEDTSNTNLTAQSNYVQPNLAQSNLGTAVLWSGPFFPVSLFGWIFLLILILILIVLARHVHGEFPDQKQGE